MWLWRQQNCFILFRYLYHLSKEVWLTAIQSLFTPLHQRGLWVSFTQSPCWASILLLPGTLCEFKAYATLLFHLQTALPQETPKQHSSNLGGEGNPMKIKLASSKACLFLLTWQVSRKTNSWKFGNNFQRISCYFFSRHLTIFFSFSPPSPAPRSFNRLNRKEN